MAMHLGDCEAQEWNLQNASKYASVMQRKGVQWEMRAIGDSS